MQSNILRRILTRLSSDHVNWNTKCFTTFDEHVRQILYQFIGICLHEPSEIQKLELAYNISIHQNI